MGVHSLIVKVASFGFFPSLEDVALFRDLEAFFDFNETRWPLPMFVFSHPPPFHTVLDVHPHLFQVLLANVDFSWTLPGSRCLPCDLDQAWPRKGHVEKGPLQDIIYNNM